MKQRTKQKPWTQMTAEELAEATRQFDKPLPPSAMRPLSPKQRQVWARAKQAGFKSVYVGKKETVVLEIDAMWLKQLDQFAAQHGMTRQELIERGLRGAMAFAT
ncbi:MAG: hypothetical protein ACHRHE_20830 [Tepidisphaerales bacterium]